MLDKNIRLLVVLTAIISFFAIPLQAQEMADESSSIETPLQQEVISINTASAEELAEMLKGVGPKKAQAIVAWRQEFGGFQHVEELLEVKGIGPSIFEKNKARITL